MHPLFFGLFLAVDPGCLSIDKGQITAGDIARRVPAFLAIDSETVFAPAPVFGARRELSTSTLKQWALQRGLEPTNLEPVCIYRRTLRSEEIDWQSELNQALDSLFGFQPKPGELEILETQLAPGGSGILSLAKNGLAFDSISKNYLWRGRIRSDGFDSAARVRFKLNRQHRRLVTARPVPASRPLVQEDFEWADFPFRLDLPPTDKLSAPPLGHVLRRSLPKRALVLTNHLMQAPLIFPGDSVELLSKSGDTTIKLQATARGKARLGESILVASLDGKRILRAVVLAPGTVVIQSGVAKRTQ